VPDSEVVELGPFYIYGSATPNAAADAGTAAGDATAPKEDSNPYTTIVHGSRHSGETDAGSSSGSGSPPIVNYADWDRSSARPAGNESDQRPKSGSGVSPPSVTSDAKNLRTEDRSTADTIDDTPQSNVFLDALKQRNLILNTARPNPDSYLANAHSNMEAILGWNNMANAKMLTSIARGLTRPNLGLKEPNALDSGTYVDQVATPEQAVRQISDRAPRLLVRMDNGETVLVRQSINASRLPGSVSARIRSSLDRSIESIGADFRKLHAYKSSLLAGDIGLAEPRGAHRSSGGDAVMAGERSGRMRVYVDQYVTPGQGSFKTGKWKSTWPAQLKNAVENMKLAPEDAHLGEEIAKAYRRGDVYIRQFNVLRNRNGQMRMSLAREVRVPVNSPLDTSKLLTKTTAPVPKPPPKAPPPVGKRTGRPIADMERDFRDMIKKARTDGRKVAADNLEHFLDGKGAKFSVPLDWLRSFSEVTDAEDKNHKRFEDQLAKLAKGLAPGASITFSDHWDAVISAHKWHELFYASGISELSSTGSFTLTRNGDTVTITGTVSQRWHDPYDWNPGMAADIPGFGTVPDDVGADLKDAGLGHDYLLEDTYQQTVTGTYTITPRYLPDRSSFTWSGP
jgi:hypothetical protein